MNTHLTIHERLRRHERDVALLDRLFADWSRGRERRNAEAHQRLDAIEAQLARLERSVRMAQPSRRPSPAVRQRSGGSQTAISLAIQPS